MDPAAMLPQYFVVSAILAATAYWWLVLVPSARGDLARSKRRGEVRAYLEEIEGDSSRGVERWFYTDWLRKLRSSAAAKQSPPAAEEAGPDARGDSTAPAQREGNLLRPSFETPMPSFWNFDNPIIAAVLLLGGFAAAGSVLSAALHAIFGMPASRI